MGIEVRSVASEHEATERTTVQRAPFATLNFEMPRLPAQAALPGAVLSDTTEIDRRTRIYKSVMQLPGYRQGLDMMAVTNGGEFADCCTCGLDSENKVAEFELVESHPEFRRGAL